MDNNRLNILMFTNSYIPHVGGVARSVESFAQQHRAFNHRVLIVAPEFLGMPESEINVFRVPALQKFNGSDFSVVLPVPSLLKDRIEQFKPHVVHAHQPFLLGITALQIARTRNLPLVYTHHRLYETHTHYVPGDSPTMQQFAVALATQYSNLADLVFAPSESTARLLQQRGVETPINIVPTGLQLDYFANANGYHFRKTQNIPGKAFVVGHLGRLAEEKNLSFLANSVAEFIARRQTQHQQRKKNTPKTYFLLIGTGPAEDLVATIFQHAGLSKQLFRAGDLTAGQLANAYDAMDVFAFASKSETQGLVISEAMACGIPVVALDAAGTRELVADKHNGRLLQTESYADFAEALQWIADQPALNRLALSHAARKTALRLSIEQTADQALKYYARIISQQTRLQGKTDQQLKQLLQLLKAEWAIIEGMASAANQSILGGQIEGKHLTDR
jgi:glycosyltransferase involved in cell wall biosynthesis